MILPIRFWFFLGVIITVIILTLYALRHVILVVVCALLLLRLIRAVRGTPKAPTRYAARESAGEPPTAGPIVIDITPKSGNP